MKAWYSTSRQAGRLWNFSQYPSGFIPQYHKFIFLVLFVPFRLEILQSPPFSSTPPPPKRKNKLG